MQIVVCSKNKAKNEAVGNIMNKFFNNYEIVSLNTNSGVSETPVGDEEGVLGCKNRIKDALTQVLDADLYVAMEGILTEEPFGTFLCGWTLIYNRVEDEYYYGCSSKDTRLSQVVADYVGSTDEEISKIGTNGLLTHGAYTRTDEFEDSVLCAISSKYNEK